MNLQEDIRRIREVMGLHEQNMTNENVKEAYSKIVSAVKGMGTNKTKVLEAINMLKSKNELLAFLDLFGDGQTGYSSFEDMINQEYDYLDYNDVFNITRALQRVNTYSTFNSVFTKIDNLILFDKGFQFVPKDSVDFDCPKRYIQALPNAVKYWKDWLNNPTTIEKIKKNWNSKTTYTSGMMVADNSFQVLYKKYFDVLDSIELVLYTNRDNINDEAEAFVDRVKENKIYVNCSSPTKSDPTLILIHEIQHLLWYIKPMNSVESLSQIFSTTNKDVSQSKDTTAFYDKIFKIENTLGLQKNSLVNLYNLAITTRDSLGSDEYICSYNEKMSNIMSIRKTLNIQPGQKMTIQNLKPYIEGTKGDKDVKYLLFCWALRFFPDINQMLDRINDLALNQTQTQQTQTADV